MLCHLYRQLSSTARIALKAGSVVSERIVVEDGIMKHKVTGKPRELKLTQQYPVNYGVEVSKAYRKLLSTAGDLCSGDSSNSDYEYTSPEWPEAHLEPVARTLCDKVGFVPCMS